MSQRFELRITQLLLDTLREIDAQLAREEVNQGLCFLIKKVLEGQGISSILCKRVFRKFAEVTRFWPKYSGDSLYPVPGVNSLSTRDSFHAYHKWVGDYGKLRWELLKFCIDQLESKLTATKGVHMSKEKTPQKTILAEDEILLVRVLFELKDKVGSIAKNHPGIREFAHGKLNTCLLHLPNGPERVTLVLNKLIDVMSLWPKYSGNVCYPVPGVRGFGSAQAFHCLNMWRGEYGIFRRELLDFCITFFVKDLTLRILKEIKEGQKSDDGICHLFSTKLVRKSNLNFIKVDNITLEARTTIREELDFLMSRWPKASSYPFYPVPGVDGLTPNQAFSRGKLWEGEYGRLRQELLDFCIDTLQKELEATANANQSK